jgi:hypothetical protein
MFEHMIQSVTGHLKIRDKHTSEMLVDKSNAIHFGNISWAITQALAGSNVGHITHMVFGSGGTSIDSSGNILYRSPNTSNLQDPTAEPYQPTYWKAFGTGGATISVVLGTSNFSDLVSNVPLSFGEPTGQDAQDQAIVTNDTYVFDEIALFTSDGGSLGTPPNFEPGAGRMLTHVIFHPVQKANNRELEIEYTIRVMMGP